MAKNRLGDAAMVKILRDAVGRCGFMHVSIGIDGGALVRRDGFTPLASESKKQLT